jgi:hypothetical protein
VIISFMIWRPVACMAQVAAVASSVTPAGKESSTNRAFAKCAAGGALRFIYHATALPLELHVNPRAGGVDINASLRGGKQDRYTGLICHGSGRSPSGNSDSAAARGTQVIMTVEISKMLEVVNLAVSGTAGNPDFTYRQPFYGDGIIFPLVSEGPGPPAETYSSGK